MPLKDLTPVSTITIAKCTYCTKSSLAHYFFSFCNIHLFSYIGLDISQMHMKKIDNELKETLENISNYKH